MQLAQALKEARCGVGAFVQRSNKEYKILIPFLKEGIEVGDNAVDTLAPGRRPEHVRRLTEAGVPVRQALSRGLLELRQWRTAIWAPAASSVMTRPR